MPSSTGSQWRSTVFNLPDLPVDDRRQDEHQTAGPAHLLLPIASLGLPPFAVVDVAP